MFLVVLRVLVSTLTLRSGAILGRQTIRKVIRANTTRNKLNTLSLNADTGVWMNFVIKQIFIFRLSFIKIKSKRDVQAQNIFF